LSDPRADRERRDPLLGRVAQVQKALLLSGFEVPPILIALVFVPILAKHAHPNRRIGRSVLQIDRP